MSITAYIWLESPALNNYLKMEFEDVVERLGSFGPYQCLVFFLISLADIFGAFAMLVPVFSGATPDWSCNSSESGIERVNSSTYLNITGNTHDKCYTRNSSGVCADMTFTGDFTSIVSQVRLFNYVFIFKEQNYP